VKVGVIHMFLHDEEEIRDTPQEKMEDGTTLTSCSLRRGSGGGVATARGGSGEGGTAPIARQAARKVGAAPGPALKEEQAGGEGGQRKPLKGKNRGGGGGIPVWTIFSFIFCIKV
jgi:hypothetical protein